MEAIEFLIVVLIIWVILFVIDIIITAKNVKLQRAYIDALEKQNKLLKGIMLNANDEDEELEDQGAMKAINTIIKYCEDHHECEGCTLDCTMLKKGTAPCFWTPYPECDGSSQ